MISKLKSAVSNLTSNIRIKAYNYKVHLKSFEQLSWSTVKVIDLVKLSLIKIYVECHPNPGTLFPEYLNTEYYLQYTILNTIFRVHLPHTFAVFDRVQASTQRVNCFNHLRIHMYASMGSHVPHWEIPKLLINSKPAFECLLQ